MLNVEDIEIGWNYEIVKIERGKRKTLHQAHNIFTNIGRQFLAEVITAQSFSGASFVRHNNEVVRYIGFGIGGSRQTAAAAAAAPYSTDYPGTNAQTDTNLAVTGLERPVRVTATPLWMREVSTPGTFPTATRTRFITTFSETDINYGGYSAVPLSEIGLFKSGADASLNNGASGAYPGAGGQMVAYDTFNTITKTGLFSIEVRWELRFG